MEVDPRLVAALKEVTEGLPVRVVHADALRAHWRELLSDGRRSMASNLPYNVAVPVLMNLLEGAPEVDPFVVMVQREVGERLAAGPHAPAFGAVSLRVAYRARVRVLRRVPPEVFWPEPNVESVVLRVDRHPPPVRVDERALFRLIDEGFAQRRKTMAGALVRLGIERGQAVEALRAAGLDPRVRAEALGLPELAGLVERLGHRLR